MLSDKIKSILKIDGRDKFILLFIILAFWSGYFLSLSFYDDTLFQDDSVYLVLSKSFAEGTGYQDLTSPVFSSNIFYPSGFPLFLTIYWHLIHPHIFLLKILLACIFMVGSWFVFLWLKQFIHVWQAYLIVLIFTSNYLFIIIGNGILTETIFIPLFYIGLFFSVKYGSSTSKERTPWITAVSWLCLSRVRVAIGIPFFAVYQFILFKRRYYTTLVFGIVILALWFVYEKYLKISLPNSTTDVELLYKVFPIFSSPFQAVYKICLSFAHNLREIATSIFASMTFPFFYQLAPMNRIKLILNVLIFLWACWGFWLFFRKNRSFRPYIYAMLISLVPIFMWQNTASVPRYLFPFFPFYCLFLILPIQELCKKKYAKYSGFFSYFMLFILLGNQIISNHMGDFEPRIKERRDFAALHAYINKTGLNPDIIFSPEHYYTYLKTGISSINFTAKNCIPKLQKYSEKRRVLLIFGSYNKLVPEMLSEENLYLDREFLQRFGFWTLYRFNQLKKIN